LANPVIDAVVNRLDRGATAGGLDQAVGRVEGVDRTAVIIVKCSFAYYRSISLNSKGLVKR